MKFMEELINEIIRECEAVLKNDAYSTPNKKVIDIVFREFTEIKNFYILNKKFLLLSSKNWKLWSIKTIIDSADYNFDNKIFDKVREFEKQCRALDEKLIEYKYPLC